MLSSAFLSRAAAAAAANGLGVGSRALATSGLGPDVLVPADSLITWQRGSAVRLRMGESGQAAERPISVMTMFRDTVELVPNKLALATKLDGNWIKYTFENFYDMTRQAARGFIELGLEPESSVGILGFNAPEWHISSLAAIFAGGYSTGIYATNSPDACRHVADHARCNIIVVENDKQLQKILSVRSRLPHLKAIVQYSGQPDKSIPGLYSWAELMALGSQSIEPILEARIRAQAPNKCCMLIYSSGTTGDPKGVMLSHDNLTWTAGSSAIQFDRPFNCDEQVVSYLPLSHIAAQMADVFVPIKIGAPVNFAQPDALRGTLGQTIKEVRPISMLGVPRVWEKMHEAIMAVGSQSGPVKRRIIQWAKDAGTRANLARMSGRRPSLSSKIADQLILSKIRDAIGLNRCHLCISSAAPISRSTLDFFVSLNLPIVEVYGMSELSGPQTCGKRTNNVVGSVGNEIPGSNIVISQSNEGGVGEMLIDGRNVCMGYLDMEDKTLEAFGGPSGTYLHTGDLARRDGRGLLHIAGRIKEIIITAGGENIPSVPIENAVKDRLPILSNCMLIGDGKRFLTMLLTVKTDVDAETLTPLNTLTPDVISWCRKLGSSATTVRDVINDVTLTDAIQKGIDDYNRSATSSAQRIQKWIVLPTDFSIGGEELGPTMKLRRHAVLRKFSHLIDAMYAEQTQQLATPTPRHDVNNVAVVTSSNYVV